MTGFALRPVEVAPAELELARWVRPGNRILWTQGSAEPLTLVEQLVAQRATLGGVRVFTTVSFGSPLRIEHRDHLTVEGLGGLGDYARLAGAGALDPHPIHLSQFCRALADGDFAVDVAFVQLAGPDAQGCYSAGADHTYTHDLIERARLVVAEVNAAAPVTTGVRAIRPDELDVVVPTSRALPGPPQAEPDDTDWRIARLAAGVIGEGATLEVGIGALPSAVLASMREHRDLAIHTGMISDAVLDLIDTGAVTHEHTPLDPGCITASSVFLSPGRQASLACYPLVLRPSRQVLDPVVLASIPRFTAINTALEVDLTGQVNAEYAGRYVGGVGGLADFVRGARASRGGVSLTVLRSRTRRGTPKVVASLSGGVVTVPRSDVDVVVTEWGTARLAGASLAGRAQRMIAIAHPDDRAALTRAWRAAGGSRR